MKMISARRTGLAVLVSTLLVSSVGFAGPAAALPAGTWWYGYLGLDKANKVSTGQGVTVAVVDTGVQASLRDLAGQVLPGKSFVGSGDARTDVPNPTATYYGHGSAMAGFIAATGKGTGYRGVAPGAKILPTGVSARGDDIDQDAVAQAITWSVDKGAKIVNLSNGSPQACPAAMQKAVDYATSRDVIVVAAVGNTPGQAIGSPANCIGAIGVGVLAQQATFGAWSGQSSGADLDFITPGQNLSTLLLTGVVSRPNGTGSSESAAIASGVFALLRAKFPQESARQIVTRAMYSLQNKAGRENFGKRINDQIGYGSLQPQFALTTTPPAGAVNPIFDQIDTHLKAASGSPGASNPASPGPASSSAAPSGTEPSAPPGASDQDSGGSSTALVAVIVVVVLGLVVLVAVLVARSRRRSRPAGHGPPGGFGPPGGGYGPPAGHGRG